jgi:hypothetical protein
MKYYTIVEMLNMIDEPNRAACIKLYNDNIDLFIHAQGSTHNHQAWEGGYHDHIAEVMNICATLYPIYNVRQLNFTLADALLIMFLHDLEKPWRDVIADRVENALSIDNYPTRHHMIKKVRKEFREEKIKEYGIILTPNQSNAFKYVEGEGYDYSSQERIMNELAAFCHLADVSSARIWHDYGKVKAW